MKNQYTLGLKASYFKHVLAFKFAAGTSRGVLKEKTSWFIQISSNSNPDKIGIGEAGPLPGLSHDNLDGIELKLDALCDQIVNLKEPQTSEEVFDIVQKCTLDDFPSVKFALEVALLDWLHGGQRMIFNNAFFKGQAQIPINGLIWMGDLGFMKEQIQEKLKQKFRCLKVKVGTLDFDEEIDLLRGVRESYDADLLELRVDANGAFDDTNAFERLERLAELKIHSIEQPVKPGQYELMADLCKHGALDIALDEELIGVYSHRKSLLEKIAPRYIILKPTLVGGIKASQEWIEIAEEMNIGWWFTSALESNVGLNAIAQLACEFDLNLPQGLGTGQLFINNIPSPLKVIQDSLEYRVYDLWNLQDILPEP